MAQLKDLIVNGATRLIGDTFANTIQITTIKAPSTSGGATYTAGTNGYVLKSNGSSVYWGSDNNSVTGVKGSSESSYRTGQVNITAANIGLGNVENTKLSTWTGSTNITTIGTLSSGTVPLNLVSGADDLKAIEALTGTTGLLKKTAANTWTLDTTAYTTNTGTITEITAGAGLTTTSGGTADGGAISASGTLYLTACSTASSAGPTAAVNGANGNKVAIPSITIDQYGRVTSLSSFEYTSVNTNTLNTAGSTNSTSKLYVIGAPAQASSTRTYSHSAVYITNGTLNATTFVGALSGTAAHAIHSGSAGYATTAAYCANADSRVYNTTATTSWSGSGPYTQAITVSGIKATDVPIVGINLSSIAYASVDTYLQEYSYIYRCVTAANQITLYALQAPSIAIPIQLKC